MTLLIYVIKSERFQIADGTFGFSRTPADFPVVYILTYVREKSKPLFEKNQKNVDKRMF